MMYRIHCRVFVVGACVGLAWPAGAAPLDPNSFASLGTLNVNSGTLTIDTSTLQVTGAASFTGVAQAQGGGLPEIAVFTFNSINIGAGVTVTFNGSRPVALLSKGNTTIGTMLDVSGGSAFDDFVGAGGPAGGASGGSGGIHDPPVDPTAGNGPGGGGVVGGGGGFGGAGGVALQMPSTGGPAYGDLATGLQGGSGGAGNNAAFFAMFNVWLPGGAGGGGGGAIEIGAIGQVQLASVNSRGGDITAFGTPGGAGSGGAVLLHGSTIAVNGSILADGGETITSPPTGFGRGGGGGGGRVHAVTPTHVVGAATPTVDVAGGPGPGFAMPGGAGVALWAPTLTIVPSGQARTLNASGVLSETLAGGFTLHGTTLQVDSGGLVFATVPVNRAFDTTLNGGAVQAMFGYSMNGGGKLSGFGQVGGALAGSASNQIMASGGTLTVGDANSTAGFNFAGAINIAAGATLEVHDADKATLGSATTLAVSARLSSLNGTTLGAGKSLTASGAATVDGKFTNQGTVNGPAAAGQFLTFTDDVDGPGGYTGNVLFSDGFSPGSSPAAVSLQNFAFDASSTLTIELGGVTAGTQYDQLNASGAATLAGTLEVKLINGFMPVLGNQFTVLTFASRSGDFSSYTGTDLGGFLQLRPQFTATTLILEARPETEGDINLDGTVDIFDVNAVSAAWGTAGPAGDANGDGIVDIFDVNLISENWGATGGDGSAAVPEPASLVSGVIASLGFVVLGLGRLGRRMTAT